MAYDFEKIGKMKVLSDLQGQIDGQAAKLHLAGNLEKGQKVKRLEALESLTREAKTILESMER